MIYLDNAATTEPRQEVIDKMEFVLENVYGNPSSLYDIGFTARDVVEDARRKVAKSIGAEPDEIFFTSGGTEANNWAIKSAWVGHIITTKTEHPSVLRSCEYMSSHYGSQISYLDVNAKGEIDFDQLRNELQPDTALVSVMMANNETGIKQPIGYISHIVHERSDALVHTDAVQAYGIDPIHCDSLGVDMMSLSAHKIGGPKGVGALYIKHGVDIDPFMHGGKQEMGYRAGTENVVGIAGFGAAAELLSNCNWRQLETVYHRFVDELRGIGGLVHGERSTFGKIISVSFVGNEATDIQAFLNMHGIACSTGSACSSGDPEPSHVLKAMGMTDELANSTVRFSINDKITPNEVGFVIDVLKKFLGDN